MKLATAAAFVLALALVALPRVFADGTADLVGSGPPTFDVDDVTGPHKGEELCYV